MHLPVSTFQTVVANTPLVSIDIVFVRPDEKILLGKRVNRPAKNQWFVPGGRIFKDEPIDAAFHRIIETEAGVSFSFEDARFLGVFEHLYSDSIFGDDVSTHYIVLAYRVDVGMDLGCYPDKQHSNFQWLSQRELLDHSEVHSNTKAYFHE